MATVTYYFNAYDSGGEEFETTPANMVDGSVTTDAQTSVNADVQLVDGNTCDGTDLGTITKVELRCYGTRVHASNNVDLRPVFSGSSDGDTHDAGLFTEGWTSYVDITSDTNAPGTWAWSDVQNLDCDVISFVSTMWILIAQVDIQVTYTEAGAPSVGSGGRRRIYIAS